MIDHPIACKFIYDDDTEELMKKWKVILSGYEESLRESITEQTKSGMVKSHDGSRIFFEDPIRQSIVDQIVKITACAIPIRVEMTLPHVGGSREDNDSP